MLCRRVEVNYAIFFDYLIRVFSVLVVFQISTIYVALVGVHQQVYTQG